MKLTRDERKQAFAGTLKVLRRKTNPDLEAGHEIVLAKTRGGRQSLFPGNDYESEKARNKLLYEGKPLTVEVPQQRTLWIVLKGWHLKDIPDGNGGTIKGWETAVTAHDHRQPTRMLSAAPSPPSEIGLKTRWAESVAVDGEVSERKVPPKGAQVTSLTAETERGYGGGGRSAVDEAAGVDDATLSDYARRIAEENDLRQKNKPKMAEKLREERKEAEERGRGNISGARAAKRRAERAAKRLQRVA